MVDLDKEFWRLNLPILLRHGHWKSIRKIVNKSPVLETDLVALMKDTDEKVREGAIMVLTDLDNRQKYFSEIKDTLDDPSPRVRGAVAKRIILVNKKQSRKLLLKLLDKEQDDSVILNIIESLKDVGERNDMITIARFMEDENKNVASQASDTIRYITSKYSVLPI